MKKGNKRVREGTIKWVPALNQVIWKSISPDIKQGALDTTTTMGAFTGANIDSVSQLNKDILEKEQEIQNIKDDLVAVEAHHN